MKPLWGISNNGSVAVGATSAAMAKRATVSAHPPPQAGFGQGVLELAARFANHERHLVHFAQHLEVRSQYPAQAVQGAHRLAVGLEAAQPRFAWRVFNEPGARRGDQ